MLPLGQLDLDDLPDSTYVRALRSGLSRLRFADDIEAQYIAAHLQHARLRVRAWWSLGVVLSLVFTVAQTLRTGVGSATFWVHCLGIIPCSFGLAWLAWSRNYERFYMPAARVLFPLLVALIAAFVAQGVAAGRTEELPALTVNMIAAFFFVGLLFRAALFAAITILLVFIATSIGIGLAHAVALKCLVVLLITAAIGAIICRDVERSYRKSFLEGALITELIARDGLSGLMNRRALDAHLLRVWQQAQRDQRMLAVLMIDIDNFKFYNDTFGHQAGDAAVRNVGLLLKGFARRPMDIAARYGGEEFVVILYDMSLAHVQSFAERVRREIQDTALVKHGASESPGITVSIGVGVVEPTVDRTPQGALQLADEALYAAKQAGRNCVVVKDLDDYRNLKTGSFRTPFNDQT